MRDPLTPRIVRYFSAEGSPVDLAVFRVVLFGWIAGAAAFSYDFAWLASVPEGLRVAPLFTAWFWENVPVNPTSARTAQFVVVPASILACIGLAYRFAAVTATVCSLYLLGIPELFGKIYHHHHLIWFAAVLAASPAADALSVDQWRRRTPQFPRTCARAYALPLRFVWVLLGVVYLFPGAAKLGAITTFADPENMTALMREKWEEVGTEPAFRLDQHPGILRLAGLGTIAFELLFLPLILFVPRIRPLLVVAGILFHLATAMFLLIPFRSLLAMYVGLVQWDRRAGARDTRQLSTRPVTRVGLAVLVPAYLFGAFGLGSWPFSAYPLFSAPAGPALPAVEVSSIPPDVRATLHRKFKSAGWARLRERAHREPRTRAALDSLIVRESATIP